jgi:hypothetical protein
MPFTLPPSEYIDLSMLATIAGVSVANSYQVTLNAKRWDPDKEETDLTPADMLAVVASDDDEPAPDNDTPKETTPLNRVQWYRNFFVTVYLAKSPDDGMSYPTWKNIVRAEVEKAVLANRYQTLNNVDYAQDTYARGCHSFNDGNDVRGIIIKFAVHYRTDDDNPYVLG